MVMYRCKIHLGYDPELARPATVTVTETELVIREASGEPIILTPNEVISFEIKGWIPFVSQVILVHHAASNKTGKVVMRPALTTCRKMMAGIRTAGFIPRAEPDLHGGRH